MNNIEARRWLLMVLACCCILGCQSQSDSGTVSGAVTESTLVDALVLESDLASGWHWYSISDDQSTGKMKQTDERSIETASRSLMGYWEAKENFVVIGHVLNRYAQRSPALPEITSADLLDMKEVTYYSPTTISVGLSKVAKCAQDRGSLPSASVACRVVVQYDTVVSVIAVYAPSSVADQIEPIINQILEATDRRIKQVETKSK